MQDIEEGFVIELEGDFAKVHVIPHSGCENCQMCDAAGMVILVNNPLKAVPGQRVKFTLAENNMMKISFILFLFPLVSIFAGLYAGSLMASMFNFNQTAAMAICAILFLAVSVAVIYFYDKKYKLNKTNFPQIIEVIKK